LPICRAFFFLGNGGGRLPGTKRVHLLIVSCLMKGSLAALICRHLQVVLRVLARLPCGLRCPRVPASARTSLACCRGYPAFAIERTSLPPSRALRAFARDAGRRSESSGLHGSKHSAPRCCLLQQERRGGRSCAGGRLHLVLCASESGGRVDAPYHGNATRCCGPCSSALRPPHRADRGDRAQVLDQHPVDGESALA
jgi:hypothetical protein